MQLQDWLIQQQQLYRDRPLPDDPANLSVHPVSGIWQESAEIASQYWWGGGASQIACQQIRDSGDLPRVGALSFGPVQSFLGGGQRLRDWAVASWLCHYLTAVLVYRWETSGGKVLLPLHQTSELLQWLHGETVTSDRFWQAELPNVLTGAYPDSDTWWDDIQSTLQQEWVRFVEALEAVVVAQKPKLLNGPGWQVVRADCEMLWSVYGETDRLEVERASDIMAQLYQRLEAQKLGRQWHRRWWGGRTSPSDGRLSIWHPGLRRVDRGGTWGLPREQLDQWWQKAAEGTFLSGLFSSSDRLNSIELVKRLASVPEFIEPTLERLWGKTPPGCPWGRFPDRTAVAAAWVADCVKSGDLDPAAWNESVDLWHEYFFERSPSYQWGMPGVDALRSQLAHPRILERRNVREQIELKQQNEDIEAFLSDWKQTIADWDSTIEWTVGWRGDGDNMGKWLSGDRYRDQQLSWRRWHPDRDLISRYGLSLEPPQLDEATPRQIELPHMLDLSVLFGKWNQLLYPLAETHHNAKVIFAGGDDFLLLGPLSEAVSLTTDLHRLWQGDATDLTQPLHPAADGWVRYGETLYPIPGRQMSFSLGVVVAQRRVPQSLWHRGLEQAYKHAKQQGRDRVCLQVLFNNGQSLTWTCPWRLWRLLMSVQPQVAQGQTELNRWEKLLAYLDSSRLQEVPIVNVGELVETLWGSVGIPLQWDRVLHVAGRQFRPDIAQWQWWLDWVAIRAFLARAQQQRDRWLEQLKG